MNISRDQDEKGRRWYERDDGTTFMSVTTVLDFLEEDTTGLDIWKERNDGEGGSPHHEHLYWYSGPRGTLCHLHALRTFEEAADDESLWGEEETKAIQKIVRGPSDDAFEEASTDETDVVYSILRKRNTVTSRDEYDALFAGSLSLSDIMYQDQQYFVSAFEAVCDLLGVTEDTVIAVEKFMLNEADGYGGQTDLVYEDPHGDIVVADLKTSSGLRHKHRLQAVAYAKAIEKADDVDVESVDRVEVWRIHPDSETWAVHSHEVPPHAEDVDNYTDDHWFKDKWGDFDYDDLEDMWTAFTELADEAHERVD